MKALARSLALVPLAGRPASSADQLQSCKTDAAEPRSSYDPPRSELERLQVDIAALKPAASITLVAFKHRTDLQRIMAYTLQPGPGQRGIQLQPD